MRSKTFGPDLKSLGSAMALRKKRKEVPSCEKGESPGGGKYPLGLEGSRGALGIGGGLPFVNSKSQYYYVPPKATPLGSKKVKILILRIYFPSLFLLFISKK